MSDFLPRGALRRHRQKWGKYGNYITFKMLETLSLLYCPQGENEPAWTSKTLSDAADMAQQPMLLQLGRMKKMGWVEWTKDAFGRKAWIITQSGMLAVDKNLHCRISFEVPKKTTEAQFLIQVVRRAMICLQKLKKAGWTDVQARECLINYPLWKIEKAFRIARNRQVRNLGAYVRRLIEWGDREDAAIGAYVDKTMKEADYTVRNFVVREACRTQNPLTTARTVMLMLYKRFGYSVRACTRRDVNDILFNMVRAGEVCLKKVAT